MDAPIRRVTRGPQQHFFGYYEKTPWSADGRLLLTLQTELPTRPLTPGDVAKVGVVDLADGEFHPLARSRAWNWQQGCMLQWLPGAPDRRIVYNDRDSAGRFVSVILDIDSGERRVLPRPIYSLSHDGRTALSIDFARLGQCRRVTGYAIGTEAESPPAFFPNDDGIFAMNTQTGESRLILSFAQVAAQGFSPDMENVSHWFEHLVWNPDDSRFLFLHRLVPAGESRMRTRLFTAAPDGSGLFCVSDHGMVSHFDWLSARQILAWARRNGIGDSYFLFTDQTDEVEVIGAGVLTADGHCSFSPDRRWLLTDTYPQADSLQTLLLYRWPDGRRIDIGKFYAPPNLRGDLRCDLHPRWNRTGDQVCIDSAHEPGGQRQVYILDVGAITNRQS